MCGFFFNLLKCMKYVDFCIKDEKDKLNFSKQSIILNLLKYMY